MEVQESETGRRWSRETMCVILIALAFFSVLLPFFQFW